MTKKQKTIIVTEPLRESVPRLPTCSSIAATTWWVTRAKSVIRTSWQRSDKLALVDGDIGLASTAEMIVGTAVSGSARSMPW